jgi:hypothetical protein
MQKTSHERADRNTPPWWLSTARWAMRSAPLAGRFFSAKSSESQQAGETIVESFDEPFEDTLRGVDRSDPAPCMEPPVAPRTETRKASNIQKPDRTSRERVILFVPGPITEADLLRENFRHARSIRLHQRRRKRFRWLRDNVGTLVFVMGLLVLAWFVAAG